MQLPRWDDVDQNESEADQLPTIAFDIQSRYKTAPRDQWITPFLEYPTLDDTVIWRVRVKVRSISFRPFVFGLTILKKGSQHNVVFAILQRVGVHGLRTAVLCAFARDRIPDSVYVESPTAADVYHTLSGIPDVLLNRSQLPWVECIPIDDRIQLLKMSTPCTIARGSWVRINRPGRYRNDLGFVLDFDNRQMDVQVAIIPRIRLTSKCDRRPAASLFDVEAVILLYGPESVRRANQIHVFRGCEFKNGLLERTLGISDLSDNKVNPTHSELSLFARCADQSIAAAAYREMAHTQVQDRIQVVTGGLQGLEGRLIDVDEHGTAIFESASVNESQAIPTHEIRKEFRLGDFVRVVSGDHQGAEGYIVAMDKPFASLYCCPPGQTYSSGGQEVDP
jgi:ribosomal protein L24